MRVLHVDLARLYLAATKLVHHFFEIELVRRARPVSRRPDMNSGTDAAPVALACGRACIFLTA